MFQKILESLVTGLVAPILLEFWKDWRTRRKRFIPDSDLKQSPGGVLLAIGRIGLSSVLGFVVAGLLSGVLTARDHIPIPFGSATATTLIVLFSIIAWAILR